MPGLVVSRPLCGSQALDLVLRARRWWLVISQRCHTWSSYRLRVRCWAVCRVRKGGLQRAGWTTDNVIQDSGARCISRAIANAGSLRELDLRGTLLQHREHLLHVSTVSSGNVISDNGCEAVVHNLLSAITCHPPKLSLHFLDLSDNLITDRGLHKLCALLSHGLHVLAIGGTFPTAPNKGLH